MRREMTISYQNRQGQGSRSRDLPTSPKLVIANHFLREQSGFSIGEKVMVKYFLGLIIISRLKS